MQLIAFFLAGAFGLVFFTDLALSIGASDSLEFTLGIQHAIASFGIPAAALVWLGHVVEA